MQNYFEFALKYIADHHEKILETIVCFALYKVAPILGVAYTAVLLIGSFSDKLLKLHIKRKIRK